jgi:acyl-[acyl-carrier-protein]-phospholipid O-acyltransferase/long-chain-fatty-acid--[acyl-carrier-protein] ligase
MTCLSLGIGAGSMLAGRLSGDKVEIGLVPLGSIFMGVFSLGLYAARGSYGFGGDAVDAGHRGGRVLRAAERLPAAAQREREKGRIIATNNIYNTLGMLLATAVFYLCMTGCTSARRTSF